MRDFPHQARQALALYLERGKMALEALKVEDDESLARLMRLRKAAFHNFRALDAMATRVGVDLAGDEQMSQLSNHAQRVDQELIDSLAQRKEQTGIEIIRIAQMRSKLSRYKSGEKSSSNRVEQPV